MIGLLLIAALTAGSASAIEIVAGEGVEPAFARQAEAGAKAWQRIAQGLPALPDAPPIRIYLFATGEKKLEAAQRMFGLTREEVDRSWGVKMGGKLPLANADPIHQAILIRLDHPGYQTPAPGFSLGKIAAHELTHLWQSRLKREEPGSGDPAWLVEGAAEFLGVRSAIAAGLFDRAQYDAYCAASMRHNAVAALSLDDMTTEPALGDAGAKTSGAVWCVLTRYFEALGRRKPNGLSAYYRSRRNGTPWPEAFEKAFGVRPNLKSTAPPSRSR
ncbi:MAG: hypothetical protein HY078_09555 [Elusimicrobia bacterium]|nr:hypothetical protein [Elusimicrobiota bacterium]